MRTFGHSLCSGSYFCARCHMIAPAYACKVMLETSVRRRLESLMPIKTSNIACRIICRHATCNRRITALKHIEVALIVVHNGWDAAVGVDLQVPVLLRNHDLVNTQSCAQFMTDHAHVCIVAEYLLLILADGDGLDVVWHTKLFKHHRRLHAKAGTSMSAPTKLLLCVHLCPFLHAVQQCLTCWRW